MLRIWDWCPASISSNSFLKKAWDFRAPRRSAALANSECWEARSSLCLAQPEGRGRRETAWQYKIYSCACRLGGTSKLPSLEFVSRKQLKTSDFRPLRKSVGRCWFDLFFKIDQKDAATIGLGDSGDVVADRYTLAAHREMTKQLCDIASDGADLGFFKF